MTDWVAWFALAGILVICEMFSGTFYLLMIGLGMAAGGIAALAGMSGESQLVVAAILGITATAGLRRSGWSGGAKRNAARDPNVNLDIGQQVVIDAWSGKEGEIRTARAMYRGAQWDVELEKGADARSGAFVIREVRGSRLIVSNTGS